MSQFPSAPPPIQPQQAPVVPQSNSVWPTIAIDQAEVSIGRTDQNTIALQHTSISRNHLKLRRTPEGLVEIEDLDSRFGTFVNGARIKKVLLKVGDTVRIGSSPPYRFNGSWLEIAPDSAGMTVKLSNVGIERDGRKLIDGINFTIQADSFVGVLGPSGAGKSLMLGTLSSTIIPSVGTIEFDDGLNVSEHLDYYRAKIGIVTQDDLVFTDLTVQENLDFAALIRLPDLSIQDRAKRVDYALDAVGLIEHRVKRVGVLSGGQRKRVSVAVELLLQPRFLLLDEPTSGLDPGMQARLMEMLRGLARRGVTVVCTTHTLDTLNFFDQLLVLGLKDRIASVMYFGSPHELLPSFGVHTQMDLFDKLQSFSGESPAQRDAAEAAQAEADAGPAAKRPRKAPIRISKPPPGKELFMQQAKVVFQRAYLSLRRDKMAMFMAVAQPLILALLVTLSQGNQFKSLSIIFFTVVCSMWLGMTLTVREVVRERKLYIRDRLAGLYPDAYLVGKLMYAGVIVLLQSSLLWFIIRFISPTLVRQGVSDSIRETSVIVGWFILLLTGMGSAIIGLLVSTLSKSERAAVTLLPLVLLPMVVLSRVVYGDIRKEWDDPSPYSAMIDFVKGKPLTGLSKLEIAQGKTVDDSGKLGAWMNFMMSAPMISRPAGGSLDMLADKKADKGMVTFELFYLLIVVGGYSGLLYWQFRMHEKTWNDIRNA